jgi:3-hydroxy-9,10-secoandrosta-1,3,5(10)-triene-9,17-dione monooxygenase
MVGASLIKGLMAGAALADGLSALRRPTGAPAAGATAPDRLDQGNRPSPGKAGDNDETEALYARARALGPVLRQRAPHCEKLRRVPEETIADFVAAGFFDVLKPHRFGGLELGPLVFLRICIEIAKHCGSSAWVLSILGVHNWRLALFADRAAEEVWSDGLEASPLIAASTVLTGTVTRVEGGYRLSGRWPFASGVDHCGWVLLAAKVPVNRDGSRSFQYLFLVPRSDFVVEDVWHSAGLKGTGTNVVAVSEAFVPAHRASSEADTAMLRRDPASGNTGPLYRYPWGLMLSYAITAPAVGMAVAAYDEYLSFVRDKVAGADRGADGNPHAHLLIARSRTTLDCVATKLEQNFAEMAGLIDQGLELPTDVRARCRWEASWMTERCAHEVAAIFEAMGAAAILEEQPIQRLFRDIHALKAHRINNAESTGENFGRLQVGLANREFFL